MPSACAAITRLRPRRTGAPELMDRRDQEAHDQFGDVSTTPIWDVMIGLSTVATVLGGGPRRRLGRRLPQRWPRVSRLAAAWDTRGARRGERRAPRGTYGRTPPGVTRVARFSTFSIPFGATAALRPRLPPAKRSDDSERVCGTHATA